MGYAQQLSALHDAVIRGHITQATCFVAQSKETFAPKQRLQVYRHAYRERLAGALRADYPALTHAAGEELFTALINDFTNESLSQHWDLNLYSPHFGEYFWQKRPDDPATSLAALEAAITHTFWQPDSPPLDPAMLATLSEEAFARQHFTLRTASQLLALGHDANRYLSQFREGATCEPLKPMAEWLLIVRHHNEVQRLTLDEAEYHLLSAIAKGAAFGSALQSVSHQPELEAKLPHYLQRWLQYGVFQMPH